MNRSYLRLAATVLLTMTVQTGLAAQPAQVPAIPQSAASAILIARAERALRDYVAACSSGDQRGLRAHVTSDAVVEYALEEPGAYLAVEAAALSANASGNSMQTGTGHIFRTCGFIQRAMQTWCSFHYTTRSDVRSPAQLRTPKHLACSRCAVIESSRCATWRQTRQSLDAEGIRGHACDRFLRASARTRGAACVPIDEGNQTL